MILRSSSHLPLPISTTISTSIIVLSGFYNMLLLQRSTGLFSVHNN